MGKFKEIDRQRQEVEEVMNEQEVITIPIYYSIDDETGIRHYDTDSMSDEFDKEIKQLEANEQAELDGWNDKMRDYAMDNMTSDVAQEVVNYE
mgnify:CR=1 FL=1|tara:strand:- start:511 stop:789 length:279 start_codon:yes stop_codon:yes gene_type:complete